MESAANLKPKEFEWWRELILVASGFQWKHQDKLIRKEFRY